MSTSQHTPEPWITQTFGDFDETLIRGADSTRVISRAGEANVARIVAAVNLCAGHPDLSAVEVVPAGVMAEVREALEALIFHSENEKQGLPQALEDARDALDKLGKG